MQKRYILVIENEKKSNPSHLPETYKNITNFHLLSDDEVSDLSWSGNNGQGWWLVQSDPVPSVTYKQRIIATHTLNVASKTCHESHAVVNMSPSEEEELNNRVMLSLKTVRNRYLSMTDFTQLPDSPISEQAKLDFKNFRQQLREMFDGYDLDTIAWPSIPTSAPNVNIPAFPKISDFMG